MSWPNKNGGGVGIVTLPGGEFGGLKDPAGASLKMPYALMQMGTTIGIGSGGTIGADGVLTLGRQMGMIYSQGLYLYFPANSIGAGVPAGLYWCIMTTTTAGRIYNNIYTSGTPVPPATPIQFSGTAGSTYVQDLSEITLCAISIPANAMGPWGHLRTLWVTSSFSGGATKTYRQRLAGQLLLTSAGSTIACSRFETNVVNSGVSFQKNAGGAAAIGPSVGVSQSMTNTNVNTALSQVMSYTGQLSSDTDYLVIEYMKIEVWPA
jgi:hypothetical protein